MDCVVRSTCPSWKMDYKIDYEVIIDVVVNFVMIFKVFLAVVGVRSPYPSLAQFFRLNLFMSFSRGKLSSKPTRLVRMWISFFSFLNRFGLQNR